jgi:hypothetical protein
VAFKDGKASGTFSMNGQSKPIAVDLGGTLFADGAGAADVLARLPLADGYTTTYRNFDLQKQKVALKQVKVVGTKTSPSPRAASRPGRSRCLRPRASPAARRSGSRPTRARS